MFIERANLFYIYMFICMCECLYGLSNLYVFVTIVYNVCLCTDLYKTKDCVRVFIKILYVAVRFFVQADNIRLIAFIFV